MSLTGLAFSLLFFALLLLALYKHPRFGLYAYMAAYYVHPPSRWWGKSLPDLRWAFLAAGVTLLALLLHKQGIGKDRAPWTSSVAARVLIALSIWIWIQNLWTINPIMHLELSFLYSKYLLLFYLIFRIADSPEEIGRILFLHVCGCLYLGFLAYGANFSGRLEGVGGPDINEANALGMQFGTGIVCGAMFILLDRSWRWFICTAGVLLALNGLILTGSRGAFLALLTGGLAIVVLKPAVNRRLFYALAGCAVCAFAYIASETFWERISTIGTAVDRPEEMDTSAESRLVIIDAQIRMAMKHPLGTGHRGTETLSRDYIPREYLTTTRDGRVGARSSHNTFMTAWVEQGIPGAVMFLVVMLWCFVSCMRLKRLHAVLPPAMQGYVAGIGAALAVFYIAGIFVDYMKAEVQIWMFALLAAVLSLATGKPAPVPRVAMARKP